MLKAVSALLSIIATVAGFFKDKQLMDAGRAEERSENQSEAIEHVQKAKDARRRLRDDPDYARGMRDRFTRD